MIDWKSAHWRIEKAASNFAYSVIDDLMVLRPTVLRDLGWAGIDLLKRSLMAAWLNRQIAG